MVAPYMCRICLEESTNRNDFISPCKCSGSSKYVHRECLNQWRSQNPSSYKQCEVCHFTYVLTKDSQEKNRTKLYHTKVQMEYFKLVGYLIGLIGIVSLFIYTIDYVFGLHLSTGRFGHIGLSIKVIVIGVIVWGYIFAIKVAPNFLSVGWILGFMLVHIHVTNYLNGVKQQIRKSIWRDNTTMEQVKDFKDENI